MVTELKLIEIGDSVGVVLPAEALERLNARAGDELILVEHPGGLDLLRIPDKE